MLHRRYDAAQPANVEAIVGCRILDTKARVDQLACHLHVLTDDEIRIVEEATK